jgi:peptide deformylase
LAAPQVGVSLRLAVVNVTPEEPKNQFVIINPRILQTEGRGNSEEGCLSLPGLGGTWLKRYNRVTVEALNEKGFPVTIQGSDLLARCLQHEIDHLNGTMIIHRTGIKQRLRMRWAIHKLKKEKLW